MNARLALLAVLGGAMSVATVAQDKSGSAAPADPAALLESCANYKFETTVVAMAGGQPRSQKVKICGVAGQTDADWKRTLEDAVKKVEANEKMEPSVKTQITTALKQEIGRLESGGVATTAGSSSLAPIPGLQDLGKSANAVPPATLRPSTSAPPRPLEQDYGNLKPLPAPLPPAAALAAASAVPRLPPPRMSLSCTRQGERGSDDCADVYVNTIFTIRADETLAPGTSLRFVRKGEDRAEIKLAQMTPGQSARIRLPNPVCLGVTRSSLEIQVLRAGQSPLPQVVDTYGPYYLHC